MNAIELVIMVSNRPEIIDAQMALMSQDEEKTVVHTLFLDKKFLFTYNVRDNITSLCRFPSTRYDINIFKLDRKVIIEMQVYTWDFK